MSFDVEIWGTVADWAIVGTAIATAFVAVRQLKIAAVAARDAVEIERANLLLRVDESYEAADLLASRKAWTILRARFEVQAENEMPRHTREEKRKRVTDLVSEHVHKMWEDSKREGLSGAKDGIATDEYLVILRLPNWLETLGHLCRRNLVPDADVLDLYDNVTIKTIGYLEPHIKHRADEGIVRTKRFLENAIWLLNKAEEFKKEREEPPIAAPSRSTTIWNVR